MIGSRAALLALALCGCATSLEVGALDPRPAVVAGDLADLELELGPAVEDRFSIRAGSDEIRVRQWRQTLARAYRHAVGARPGAPRLVARIERAELTLVDGATVGMAGALASLGGDGVRIAHGSHGAPTPVRSRRVAHAKIAFAATLTDVASGQVIARLSGAVTSSGRGDVSDVIRECVERLFERLLPELARQAAARG